MMAYRRYGVSRRDIVQEFKDHDLKNERATTVKRKHQDEEVEDQGITLAAVTALVVRREKRQLGA